MANEDYSKNTKEYVEWVKSVAELSFPKEAFPYVSERKKGRNLSEGDKILWYLTIGIPLALNGQTGVGKSTAVEWFAHDSKRHLEQTNAGPNDTVEDFLVKAVQDNKGDCVFMPQALVRANVYEGIYFLDEASILDEDAFTSFNRIIQGFRRPFMTQYGGVDLNWKNIQYVIAGNFHYKNPCLDAASLYRFVWMEFEVPSNELATKIGKQHHYNRANIKENIFDQDLELPKKLDPNFPKSKKYCDEIETFAVELWATLLKFSVLNRSKNGMTMHNQGVLKSLYDYFSHFFKSDIPMRKSVEKYLCGMPWSRAPDITLGSPRIATSLFHPDMSAEDYKSVLKDIFVHPAIATSKEPLKYSIAAYKQGMEKIIDEKVDKWYEVIMDEVMT